MHVATLISPSGVVVSTTAPEQAIPEFESTSWPGPFCVGSVSESKVMHFRLIWDSKLGVGLWMLVCFSMLALQQIGDLSRVSTALTLWHLGVVPTLL